eukprot:7115466-Prymnesium_polylepis.1
MDLHRVDQLLRRPRCGGSPLAAADGDTLGRHDRGMRGGVRANGDGVRGGRDFHARTARPLLCARLD